MGRPFGHECREFLRKLTIGKAVSVEVDYSRTQEKEGEKSHTMVFATVDLEGKNVQLECVKHGWGEVKPTKEGETRVYAEMKKAEEAARGKKQGIWKAEGKLPRFVDYSSEKGASKAKQFFSFIDKEKKFDAVVELVLNGQRVKLRLSESNEMFIFQLNGIKCLQNDPNIKQHQLYSQKALEFSKANLNQRDVLVQFDDCDKNGTFHGSILLQKKNYASTLLENVRRLKLGPGVLLERGAQPQCLQERVLARGGQGQRGAVFNSGQEGHLGD